MYPAWRTCNRYTSTNPAVIIRWIYRTMYHWQSEHELGTCMIVPWCILAVQCKIVWTAATWPRDTRRGHTAWPSRSPDSNPLNFYFWGHLKSLVQLLLATRWHFTIRM
jgi:hypothetical protein